MCGIGAINTAKADFSQINVRLLAKNLMRGLQVRGKHASGAAWYETEPTEGHHVFYAKKDIPARQFIPALDQMPRKCRNVILHTRYATLGDPADNRNNHPILVPGIVGVHNGVIRNHNELIARHGGRRTGEVDSESLFRLLQHSPERVADLATIQGAVATAWIDVQEPRSLHLARCSGRPMAVAQTKNGSTIMASTKDIVKTAMWKSGVFADFEYEVPEWTYLKVTGGSIVEYDQIPVPDWYREQQEEEERAKRARKYQRPTPLWGSSDGDLHSMFPSSYGNASDRW